MMNTYPYIKNIEHEKILKIADQVNADAGQVVSKTLAQNDFVSVTLFAFAKGEEIGTHDSIGDAMVTVIEGTGKFVVDGKEYILNQGETLVMPAKKPHSVHAVEAFKMMLVVIFPLEQEIYGRFIIFKRSIDRINHRPLPCLLHAQKKCSHRSIDLAGTP